MNNRILVIGCSGGGKSTLTAKIAEKLNLPIIHLDYYYWQPGWVETPTNEWRDKIHELIKPDKWAMDGTFSESFDLRFPVADKIVIVDMPRRICLWRAATRVIKYSRKNSRPDMANGCHENFDLNFYKYIWTFKSKVFPQIEAAIDKFQCQEKVIVLRSDRDVRDFLDSLQSEG